MNRTSIREYLLNRIVDKLTEFYILDTGKTIEEALHKVYCSRIYEALSRPDSYLLSESPSYIYVLMMAEYKASLKSGEDVIPCKPRRDNDVSATLSSDIR